MSRHLVLTPAAVRHVRGLPPPTVHRIDGVFALLQLDPYPAGAQRLPGEPLVRRIEAGRHRVLYEVVLDVVRILAVRDGPVRTPSPRP